MIKIDKMLEKLREEVKSPQWLDAINKNDPGNQVFNQFLEDCTISNVRTAYSVGYTAGKIGLAKELLELIGEKL